MHPPFHFHLDIYLNQHILNWWYKVSRPFTEDFEKTLASLSDGGKSKTGMTSSLYTDPAGDFDIDKTFKLVRKFRQWTFDVRRRIDDEIWNQIDVVKAIIPAVRTFL